ncbi:uncharacterized protein LOC115449449 isoform X2 [Manduca sexta]|uniref:uncharacterized protein LOC115449449 isoform X2 n=1 Tax=Manduca sexta TaxID=7130 RepID=UPI0018905938|nr:uncharacterized protein LOC115449449 isoform X2 [Manduca sexta]
MAHFALLWKARIVEKYRVKYENEKINSIAMADIELPKKNVLQKWRHYRFDTQKRISKTFRQLYPEGSSLSNFIIYLRTKQTFTNILVKAIFGFIGGYVLSYLCFIFFVYQLSISVVYATVLSFIIGILLTLGLAFSYRIRCLIFLLVPQFFSRFGRYTLTCYALILILTGPATNTLKNSEVLSESMACSQEQIKTSLNNLNESVKKPHNFLKDSVKQIMEKTKKISLELKQIMIKINRLILSVVSAIQMNFEWLKSIAVNCNKKLGTPHEFCTQVLKNSIAYCEEVFGAVSKLCDKTNLAREACADTKAFEAFCGVSEFVDDCFLATVRRRLKDFSDRIEAMMHVEVRTHHSYSFSADTSGSTSQVAAGIVTEIRNRADPLLTWLSWSSCVTSLFLLLIIFRAKYYQHMYETRSRFDNRYVSKELRDLDLKRLREGRETILPLNRREKAKYINITSFRLLTSERTYWSRSVVFMTITTFKLLIHMVADYSLYWVLMTIKYHGSLQTPLPAELPRPYFDVSDAGLVGRFLKSTLSILEIPLFNTDSSASCLPNPKPPDFRRYTQIGVLIFLLWFFALFEPYGLRLRHVIMSHYRPERARERAVWLYNHILRTRGSFMKFARRKLHREYKYRAQTKLTFRMWFTSLMPFNCLRSLLDKRFEEKCLLCGTTQLKTDPDTQMIRCECKDCPGTYCCSCFAEIGQLCTICLSPEDYGDLSDVSLERGSSGESSDSEDENDDNGHSRINTERNKSPGRLYNENNNITKYLKTTNQKNVAPRTKQREDEVSLLPYNRHRITRFRNIEHSYDNPRAKEFDDHLFAEITSEIDNYCINHIIFDPMLEVDEMNKIFKNDRHYFDVLNQININYKSFPYNIYVKAKSTKCLLINIVMINTKTTDDCIDVKHLTNTLCFENCKKNSKRVKRKKGDKKKSEKKHNRKCRETDNHNKLNTGTLYGHIKKLKSLKTICSTCWSNVKLQVKSASTLRNVNNNNDISKEKKNFKRRKKLIRFFRANQNDDLDQKDKEEARKFRISVYFSDQEWFKRKYEIDSKVPERKVNFKNTGKPLVDLSFESPLDLKEAPPKIQIAKCTSSGMLKINVPRKENPDNNQLKIRRKSKIDITKKALERFRNRISQKFQKGPSTKNVTRKLVKAAEVSRERIGRIILRQNNSSTTRRVNYFRSIVNNDVGSINDIFEETGRKFCIKTNSLIDQENPATYCEGDGSYNDDCNLPGNPPCDSNTSRKTSEMDTLNSKKKKCVCDKSKNVPRLKTPLKLMRDLCASLFGSSTEEETSCIIRKENKANKGVNVLPKVKSFSCQHTQVKVIQDHTTQAAWAPREIVQDAMSKENETCTCATQRVITSRDVGTWLGHHCNELHHAATEHKRRMLHEKSEDSQQGHVPQATTEDYDFHKESSGSLNDVNDSFTNESLTCLKSESSLASNGSKTDTTIISLATLNYREERKTNKRKTKTRVVTKTNRSTLTEKAKVCDVSTITNDWWSPIVEKKKAEKEISLEKKKGDCVMREVKKRLRNRGMTTDGRIVTFRSRTQLIPPGANDVMSPSRYLLESQKYYNELFSSKYYTPHMYVLTQSQQRQENDKDRFSTSAKCHRRRGYKSRRQDGNYSKRSGSIRIADSPRKKLQDNPFKENKLHRHLPKLDHGKINM